MTDQPDELEEFEPLPYEEAHEDDSEETDDASA